ncbi:MAG: energy transducer TonB [Bacteroidales bacterium]|nr:energy transducer TonB [Bacteroidales bacterium]
MKEHFKSLSLFALLIMLCAFSLNVNAQEEVFDNNEPIFTVVEDPTEFPGGKDSLNKFISDNIIYPQEALDKGIEGKVYITFVVEKDGSINDIKIIRDIGYGCGEEAKRIVKLMPKWKPAKQRGKFVRQQFVLPVNFNLASDEE